MTQHMSLSSLHTRSHIDMMSCEAMTKEEEEYSEDLRNIGEDEEDMNYYYADEEYAAKSAISEEDDQDMNFDEDDTNKNNNPMETTLLEYNQMIAVLYDQKCAKYITKKADNRILKEINHNLTVKVKDLEYTVESLAAVVATLQSAAATSTANNVVDKEEEAMRILQDCSEPETYFNELVKERSSLLQLRKKRKLEAQLEDFRRERLLFVNESAINVCAVVRTTFNQETLPILNIPIELVAYIISFMPLEDMIAFYLSCSSVKKALHQVYENPHTAPKEISLTSYDQVDYFCNFVNPVIDVQDGNRGNYIRAYQHTNLVSLVWKAVEFIHFFLSPNQIFMLRSRRSFTLETISKRYPLPTNRHSLWKPMTPPNLKRIAFTVFTVSDIANTLSSFDTKNIGILVFYTPSPFAVHEENTLKIKEYLDSLKNAWRSCLFIDPTCDSIGHY